MRPTQFSPDTIVALLRKQTVVSLAEVMAALGTRARRTAFRKLKDLAARNSYSHRGGYYTLDELVDFDDRGLWSFDEVRFSSAGTLIRNRRVVRQPGAGGTLRRGVGQPAPCRHPGRAAQARPRRAVDPAQARTPVPVLRGRPQPSGPTTAGPAPAARHPRTRTARARRRPDTGGAPRRDRPVRQPPRRTPAPSVRGARVPQVRVGRRPARRGVARRRPRHRGNRPPTTRRARCRRRPGAACGGRTAADGKKRRKSSPASKP